MDEKKRITKYDTHVQPKLFLIECWARDGIIDEDIAKKLGIAYSTFNEYKKMYLEFSEALKKGKEVIDYQVENALLKRALGYKYTEVTEEGSEFGTKRKEVLKEVVPDVTAQIFWLKNRKPDKWRANLEKDKLELEKEKHEFNKQQKNPPEAEETESDGFIEALNASAEEVWSDEDVAEDEKKGSI